MPSKNVAEDMRDFQEKYGFLELFDDLEKKGWAKAEVFKNLDSFLPTGDKMSFESRQYLHGFTYMLNKYVNDNLRPEYNSQKVYSLGNLNIMDFVNEYENIVQKKHEIKNPNTPRKPFAGIEIDILKTAESFAKELNKPLIDVWADKIDAGTYSISDLRDITKNTGRTHVREHIKTSALIYGAMEKIADKRSLGWKLNPLNWPRMIQEYRYRNEIYSMLEEDKRTFLDIREEISDAQRAPMIDPKMSEEIGKLRQAKEAETKIQQEKELQAKQEKESAEKTKVVVNEAANDLVKDGDVKQPIKGSPEKELNNSRNF